MKDQVIQSFQEHFGRTPVVVSKSPGRINCMGRHVDHQGGDVNMLALDKYIYLGASPNNDRVFRFRNVDRETFPDFDFRLSDAPSPFESDWLDYVDSSAVIEYRNSLPLWCRYLTGAVLRAIRSQGSELNFGGVDESLKGLDICVGGDLPAAAGLSSSSAMVLSMVLAMTELRGLEADHATLIQWSSEGEKFVGVKGGTSDPAAMLASRSESVVQLGCVPFALKGVHPFPAGHRIVLANSLDRAAKGDNAKNGYNWRVACYRLSRVILHRKHPEWCDRFPQLRDYVAEDGLSLSDVYRCFHDVPFIIDREQLLTEFTEDREEIESIFVGHTMPGGGYPLRDILLYGFAEMARSRRLGGLLQSGDLETLGRWIRRSHDGDRVSRAMSDRRPWRPAALDGSEVDRLITLAEQGAPEADLVNQCGAYQCSTENVDELVDLCDSIEGCHGSQILGAGLGGCIMALVREDKVDELTELLTRRYYESRSLPPNVWSIVPGEGASVSRWS